MPDIVLFDRLQINLLVAADVEEAAADAARAALDDPSFLDAVRQAVQAILTAVPALAALSAQAEW